MLYNVYILLTCVILFADDSSLVDATLYLNDRSFETGKLFIDLSSTVNVKGVQFKIIYDSNYLKLEKSNINLILDKFNLYAHVINENEIECLIFNNEDINLINTDLLTKRQLVNLDFKSKNNFTGITQVKLDNILIIDKNGQEINSNKQFVLNISYQIPSQTLLESIMPNPFNSSTTINYQIAIPGHITLTAYNKKGFQIKKIYYGYHDIGYYEINWDATDYKDEVISNGHYDIVMNAPAYSKSLSVTFIR